MNISKMAMGIRSCGMAITGKTESGQGNCIIISLKMKRQDSLKAFTE